MTRFVASFLVASVACFTCLGACGGIVEEVVTENTYTTDASVQASPGTAGEAAIGSACTSDSQCTGTSDASALTCMTNHNGIEFPGGYCSQTCLATSGCPTGSFCGISGYDLGELARCMDPCTSGGSTCRAGYTCLEVTDTAKQTAYGCWTIPAH